MMIKSVSCQPPVKLSISLTRSLYHYLVENLNITEESEKLDAMFKGLMKKSDNGYLADMEEFGKMFDFIGVCNSYNGESFLSQVIQYVIFRQGETSFIILQIHNGCDVRGGYTEPRIFEIDDKYLPSDSDFYTNDGHYTDDGYHWYSDDTSNEVKPVDIWYEKEDKLYDKKTNKEVVFL